MLLGELLLKQGLLTPKQLEEALAEQKKTNEFLGKVLIQKGFLDESKLVRVLSEQFNIPFVDLKGRPIDWEVALRFSSSLVVDHQFLPVQWDTKGVTVAITDPLDACAISEVQKAAQFDKVNFILVTSEAMRNALAVYNQKLAEKIKRLFEK